MYYVAAFVVDVVVSCHLYVLSCAFFVCCKNMSCPSFVDFADLTDLEDLVGPACLAGLAELIGLV